MVFFCTGDKLLCIVKVLVSLMVSCKNAGKFTKETCKLKRAVQTDQKINVGFYLLQRTFQCCVFFQTVYE